MKKKPLTGVDPHTPKDFMIPQQLQDRSSQYCGRYWWYVDGWGPRGLFLP